MLPLNKNQFPLLYKNALGLMQAGKNDAALTELQKLEKMAPSRPEVPFQIGRVYYAAGMFQKSSDAFERALRLAPKEKPIWQAWADVVAADGDVKLLNRAKKALKGSGLPADLRKALLARMSARKDSTHRLSRGVSAVAIRELLDDFNHGRLDKVETGTRAILARQTDNEIVQTILGATLAAKGDTEGAEAAFRAAIAIDPDYGEARAYLGELLMKTDRRVEASTHLMIAWKIIPQSPIVLGNLGRYFVETGDFTRAVDVLDRLLKIVPDNRIGRIARAQALIGLGRSLDAVADLDRLTEDERAAAPVLALKAKALSLAGQMDQALETAKAALELKPDSLQALNTYSDVLGQQGRFDEVQNLLDDARNRGIRSGVLMRQAARGRKMQADDPLIAEMKDAWQDDTVEGQDRIALGFALAKAMEDTKQFDQVWQYLGPANDLVHESMPFDPEHGQRDFERNRALFKGMDTKRLGKVGFKEDRTIFVTGLPRSGTTLVEQILASHSTVTGGNEVGLFGRVSRDAISGLSESQRSVDSLTDTQLTRMGREFSKEMAELFPNADRVTDKALNSYQLAGLIWLALPNAKIVSLRRDPRDNLLSMYKNQFQSGTHIYAYNQTDLVEHYRLYLEYCALWRSIAPDRFYEIRYEDIVADPEGQTRALLQFCELEWEEACLSFHETERVVNTLSLYQVRQPLYASSVGRWKQFEDELGEMLEGLEKMGVLDDHGNAAKGA